MKHAEGFVAAVLVVLSCSTAWGAQWSGPLPVRIFDKLDVNGDAVVDAHEVESARRSMFDRADADQDGYVTDLEAHALFDVLRASGGSAQRPLLRSRLASRRPAEQANLLARFDTDGDGRVGESEFLSGAYPFMARFDADNDGRLTRDEVEQGYLAREELRQKRAR